MTGSWVHNIVNRPGPLKRRLEVLIENLEPLSDVLIKDVHVGLDGSRAALASSGGARTLHGGASAAPCRRNPILCYGGQILIRFRPMASQWRGESVFAHLVRQWSTVAAGDGGTIRVDLGGSRSLLQRLGCPVFLVQ
jgi:hypothetical protein